MTYDLVYTERAKRDLHNGVVEIARNAPQTAERWFEGFINALGRLRQEAPNFSLAPESGRCSVEVRQFIYRTKSRRANRALYTIRGGTVFILAIRRPGHDLLTEEELESAVAEVD
jgi:plasmid stabilization system protein ParE